MNRHEFQGARRHVRGRARTTIGAILGDPIRQILGAIDQVAGGARYGYGRAHTHAGRLAEDGRHLAHDVRDRAGNLIDEGRHFAGEVRDRAGNLIDDGREFAEQARDRAGNLIDDGRHLAHHTHRRGLEYGRQAVDIAEENRATTLAAVAVLAFGLGWYLRPTR